MGFFLQMNGRTVDFVKYREEKCKWGTADELHKQSVQLFSDIIKNQKLKVHVAQTTTT